MEHEEGEAQASLQSQAFADDSRFQELVQQMLEEHVVTVSDLREANELLRQELRLFRPEEETAEHIPKELVRSDVRAPPSSDAGLALSSSFGVGSWRIEKTKSKEDEGSMSPSPRARTQRESMQTQYKKAIDSAQEGFVLKGVWTEYDSKSDHGSSFHYYVAATNRARMNTANAMPKTSLRVGRDLIGLRGQGQPLLPMLAVSCMPGVISPSGTYRMIWDLLGLLFILYDTFMIPMQVFDIDKNGFVGTFDWITLLFWTFDMVQSFFTGYFKEGVQVMEPRKIVMNYLKTWFIIDLVVVGPEWFTSLSPDGFGLDGVGIGRILRLGRAMRVLRLLRLLKLRRIVDALLELVESEYTFTLINLAKLLFAVLVLNHVIACVWYFVGTQSMLAGLRNWFEMSGEYVDDQTYMYFTALHWSLTQFTPASMNVSAANTWERVTSILVLFFAMVAFSSIVGHITASMSHLQNLRGAHMKQFWLLRRYMKQRRIRRELQLRITKFLEYKAQKEHDTVHSSSVLILEQLSEPLRKELSYETMVHWIASHPFFSAVNSKMPVFMHRLCHSALNEIGLASGDIVFTAGHEAKQMLFIKHGNLEYVGLNRLILDPPLQEEEWFVEAAIWVPWRHMGDCKVLSPGELIGVCNEVFAREMSLHHLPWSFCKMYAIQFCESLNTIEPEDLTDVLRDHEFGLSEMVHQAINEFFPDVPEIMPEPRRH
ncbi:Potassium voltage-gated channel protein eag (Ether-a-go-go protein) [Durusdinium trenchii]|uniref:Potassium voltage-gated channel protein eag (Ether-a-go-go protein) n=1 Tax=Durusdinium trenchii TaxID=1381693 RepID=A0ABP0JKC8_9DINO